MTAVTTLAALALATVTLVTPAMLEAQTTAPTPAPTPVPTSPATPSGGGVTQGASGIQIVEVSQAVPAGGTGVTGFTPPPSTTFVVTDMLVTNPNTTAVCGVDLARAGTPVTGGVCVGSQATLDFAFTTGIEFTDVAPVQFVNASSGTEAVRVHLRGFLLPSATTPTGTTPSGTVTPSG